MKTNRTDSIVVSLYKMEFSAQCNVGIQRTLRARADNRKLEEGREDSGFENDIHGWLVEYAVGKQYNLFPDPKVGYLDTRTGDLSHRIQCKSITSQGHSLIVQEDDETSHRFILGYVDVGACEIHLLGWTTGANAKAGIYFTPKGSRRGIHQSAFFVPQSALWSIKSFQTL